MQKFYSRERKQSGNRWQENNSIEHQKLGTYFLFAFPMREVLSQLIKVIEARSFI